MAKEGAQWDSDDSPLFNPTNREFRYMKQDEKQLRHEEIIRMKRLMRERQGGMDDFRWDQPSPSVSPELWMEQAEQMGIPYT